MIIMNMDIAALMRKLSCLGTKMLSSVRIYILLASIQTVAKGLVYDMIPIK